MFKCFAVDNEMFEGGKEVTQGDAKGTRRD